MLDSLVLESDPAKILRLQEKIKLNRGILCWAELEIAAGEDAKRELQLLDNPKDNHFGSEGLL